MAKSKPAPNKKATPAPAAVAPKKKHERSTKPSEADRLEKGKFLVAAYLVRRDGMDADTAMAVVEGLSADERNSLIEECNTSTMEAHPVHPPADVPATGSTLDPAPAAVEEEEATYVDFTAYPALLNDEAFVQEVLDCMYAAQHKGAAEKVYKAFKKRLIPKLKDATGLADPLVQVMDVKLAVYEGSSTFLDETKLLEAGVSPEQIKKGYKTTKYTDVRVLYPKPAPAPTAEAE